MKTIKISQILLFALLVSCYNANAQKQDDNLLEFNLTSMALEKCTPAKSYKLTLYKEGEIVESVFIKNSGPVNINLKVDQVYTVVFEKDSLPKKMLIINTELPKQNMVLKTNNFEFEVELSPDLSNQKEEMLDFPVGYVFYTKENKRLVPSDLYRHNINKSN